MRFNVVSSVYGYMGDTMKKLIVTAVISAMLISMCGCSDTSSSFMEVCDEECCEPMMGAAAAVGAAPAAGLNEFLMFGYG